jgi:hypothetical protein
MQAMPSYASQGPVNQSGPPQQGQQGQSLGNGDLMAANEVLGSSFGSLF